LKRWYHQDIWHGQWGLVAVDTIGVWDRCLFVVLWHKGLDSCERKINKYNNARVN